MDSKQAGVPVLSSFVFLDTPPALTITPQTLE